MSCPSITTIPRTECIGNSLVTINANFGALRTAICEISAGVAVLKDSEQVGSNVTTFNFIGDGVTVSGTGTTNNAVTVNVPKFNPLRVSLLEEQGINSGGGRNNFFILNDGSVRVCGLNSYGELGVGAPDSVFLPRIAGFSPPLQVDETIIRVYTHCHNAYVITSKGRLYGAGYNRHGQIGQGNTNTLYSAFTFINVLGDTFNVTPYDFQNNPVPGYAAATTDPVVRVSTGSGAKSDYLTIFAVTQSGALYAWGDNSAGQTGTVRTVRNEIVTSPRRVGYVGSVAFITSGGNDRRTTTFIKDTAGKLFVCGRNQDGQAGIGDPNVDVTTFQPVVGLPSNYVVNNVRCGGTVDNISAWITLTDGTLWAAGYDNNGQVTGSKIVPTIFYTRQRQTRFGLVAGFDPFSDFIVDVVAHADSDATTCWALIRDGDAYRLKGWGNNSSGCLGLGDMSLALTGTIRRDPRQPPMFNPNWPWVQTGAKVKQVVVAGNGTEKTTLVLDTNNNMWASGYGGTGLLGRGTLNNSETFVRVLYNPALGVPVQIRSTNNDSGFANFLCLLNTGRVLAWGYDSDVGYQQLSGTYWYYWWPNWPYWRYDRTGSGQLGVDASPRITAVPSLVQIYV